MAQYYPLLDFMRQTSSCDGWQPQHGRLIEPVADLSWSVNQIHIKLTDFTQLVKMLFIFFPQVFYMLFSHQTQY